MSDQQHIQGGVGDAAEGADHARPGSRRLSFWSHDVMFATALTVMAASLLVLSWLNGGARQGQQAGPTTAVTTK